VQGMPWRTKNTVRIMEREILFDSNHKILNHEPYEYLRKRSTDYYDHHLPERGGLICVFQNSQKPASWRVFFCLIVLL
ncbi:MAG: hypothetical protein MI864_26440, partial [Pseudomonadales bacterium]|nr:hypothetical protein [Pseudomonadales bacterium]